MAGPAISVATATDAASTTKADHGATYESLETRSSPKRAGPERSPTTIGKRPIQR
jgi:hypothetical protein